MDALSTSYDPDEGPTAADSTGLEFKWMCRRSCENYPKYDELWTIVEEQTEFCDDYLYLKDELPDVGCFYGDQVNTSGNFLLDLSQKDLNLLYQILQSMIMMVLVS